MLTNADIDRLLGDKPSKQVNVLTRDGWVAWKTTAPIVGAYEGRAGTPRRSRKGRVWREPNGRREYLNGSDNVIAYKTKRSS